MPTDYPGNPANFPANVPLVDDGDLRNSANLGLASMALADRTAYLEAFAQAFILPPTFQASYLLSPLGGPITAQACAFDPATLKWLIGGVNGAGHLVILTGRGDPLQWVFAGGGVTAYAGTIQSLCRGNEPGVSSKYVYAGVLAGGHPFIIRADTVGFAFANTDPGATITDGTQCAVVSVSGAIIAAVGSSNAAHANVFASTDSGATWVAQGVTVPGAVATWLVAQSAPGGGLAMIFPSVAVAGGPGYLTTLDGVTWTSQTGPVLLATETPATLCYGTDGAGVPCFILTTVDSASLFMKTYRSYNGTTWAAFANDMPVSTILAKMAAVGRTLVGLVFDSGSFTRVVYSLDGGATWLTTNTESFALVSAAIAGSNNQFCLATDVALTFSQCLGSPGGLGAK